MPFASYGHRGPAGGTAIELSQSTCSVRTDVLPERLVITNCSAIITYIYIYIYIYIIYIYIYIYIYIFRRMSIYVIGISVVFITFMLLFTFNLGAYSANGNATVRQNSKVEGMAMQ